MTTHISLYVTDIRKTNAFYELLFGQPNTKQKEDYLKFELQQANLVISFVQNPSKVAKNFGHLGFRVSTITEIQRVQAKFEAAGFTVTEEKDVNCCYAKQDKIWLSDPDGHQWEVYVFHEDSEFNDPRNNESSACCTPDQQNTKVGEATPCC